MNILFINSEGTQTLKVLIKSVNDIQEEHIDTYIHGRYKYHVIKISQSYPIKLKFSKDLIHFSVFVIKSSKNNKILDIFPDEIIDQNLLLNQVTCYDSDSSSDIEFDICNNTHDSIC